MLEPNTLKSVFHLVVTGLEVSQRKGKVLQKTLYSSTVT